jgi:PAS domain S-box-containing protein
LSYRRLFEAARDGILILDVDTGCITDVNPFLVELLGFSRSDMVGKTVGELSPFKDVVSNQTMLERLQRDGYVRYHNLPLETRDGCKIAVEFVSNVYQVGDKKVIQCNIRDITDQRRMETALIHFRSIVESSGDAIISKDLNGIITSWNTGAEKIFGYTSDEMVGASIMRLIPDDRRDEEDKILEKIRRGESLDNFETLRKTKGGSLIHVSATVCPIKDLNGRIIGVSKVAHDITERKEHECEIKRLSRLYAALSHVNQAIVTLNNREELFAEVCRVLVEIGKLRMAWVGWLDAKTRQVIPVAQCGDGTNYLSRVTIYADDRPEGQGPTGTAIREEQNYICNDFSHDPRTLPWRKSAEQAGFRSSASLVIRLGGVICGAITVYAGETDFFQDKEIALLEEATADISFALDNFVREEARRQAEIELRWKTAFLEAQVDSSLDGILVVDDQGKKLLQNQRMVDLWKIPPEVVRDTDNSVQVKFVTDRTKNPRQFADKVAYLNTHPDEVSRDEVELMDGTFLDRYSAPVHDKAGKHYGRIWTFRDITERKRTETAALEAKRFLRSTLDALSAHIAILDEHGTVVAVNAAWKRFADDNKFTGSNGVGENYLKICDSVADHCSEEASAVSSGIRTVMAGQSAEFNWEYSCHSPTEKRWFVVRVTRFSGDGPVRVVVAHENISIRKQIEMRFRRLVDSNAQGVVFWNTQGQITEANAAFLKLVGCTRANLEAGPIDWRAMTPAEYADIDRRALKELITTGVCRPYEKEYIRKDGKRVSVLIGAAAFEDDPKEGVAFVLDLTERKLLEQQFRQAQKMESIGTLASGVAHDFNNILAVIQMQAGLLKDEGNLSAAQSDLADDISSAVQRAVGLTRQLLLFSRTEVLQLRDLDLNHSVAEMTKMLRRILGENIAVKLNLAAQPMFLHADAGMMDQVLMNLAVNARDAMFNGGQLVIETTGVEFDEFAAAQTAQARPGSFVRLSVSDNGCGIPPENLGKIFEPFFTTKGVGKGTGLGLATVFGIAQQHQGWVNVHSEVGHGTTFTVYLPRLSESQDAKIIKKLPATALTGHETILLVEDEPALRTMIGKTLARLGYRVLEASTGFKALDVWKEHPAEINLLLTDLMMPDGMTGKELGLRLLQENPKLKVIYMSGYSADIVAQDFSLQEGVNFLVKPFQMQQLAQIIRDCLDAIPWQPAGHSGCLKM